MPVRLKRLIGAVLLLLFIPVYALFAMAGAAAVLPGTGPLAQFGYYAVAGLLWVLPAGVIVTWMFRPPRSA